MNELINKVEQWAIDRNLHTASPQGQALKVVEEFTEAIVAYDDYDKEEMIDGVGDTYVTLIILCQQLKINFIELLNTLYDHERRFNSMESLNQLVSGVAKGNINLVKLGITGLLIQLDGIIILCQSTSEKCLTVAYNEIKDRTGKMVDGIFVKTEDL